jgi:hypothetical protein
MGFIIIIHLRLGLSISLFFAAFPTEIVCADFHLLYVPYSSSHLIFLRLNNPKTLGVQ